jgi:ATP-binding cassette subfamily B protein
VVRGSSSGRCSSRYPSADEVSLESVAKLDTTVPQQVLFDVSFRAEPGQLVALVRAFGAGKTTLTSFVTRIYGVQGGSVEVAGQDVRGANLDSLRGNVGVVMQDAYLFHDTVRANK